MGQSPEAFTLSQEQEDTAILVERLLGRAVANRYVDFSRLAASATGLRVSRPLAGHALRELESMIRASLVVPMDAKASIDAQDTQRSGEAARALKQIGYDDDSIERAQKALTPRLNHAMQIQLIAQRLGLSPDGDIAVAWVSLCRTFGQAHERHYHKSLSIDDEFRENYQKPFDMVVRGILTALQKRYAALMQRVEAIAAMTDYAQASKIFENEIPGAPPLQWHFFQSITSPKWLPHLLRRNLISEPPATDIDIREFGEWPVGHYLLTVAKSDDAAAHSCLVEAIQRVALSKHPDVRRQGLEIIATLPPDVASQLVDIAIGWLEPETQNFYYIAPEVLLKRLAEGGHIDAAIKLGAALFQVFDQGGNLASLHPQNMYEHHLPGAVAALSAKNGPGAVRLFSELLLNAANITRRTADAGEDDRDYTYSTPHPISGNQMADYGVYEALIVAVRDASLIGCEKDPSRTSEVVEYLNSFRWKIFKRIALHVLSRNATSAPELARTFLLSNEFIGQAWCEEEYAELALSYFQQLLPGDQARILATIDAMPDRHFALWKENFASHHKREPNADDERRFVLGVIQEATWKWRDALPPDRKLQLEKSAAELGDPDLWYERLFPPESSPLSEADFSSTPMRDVLAFLRSWEPSDEPVRRTITALGQELRNAVEKNPSRFADVANQFADVRPIYIRRILEGFDTKVRNRENMNWGPIVQLLQAVMLRLKEPDNTFPPADGDDKDWFWCCSSAGALLKSGLRRGEAGIPLEYASQIEEIISNLFEFAPRKPREKDFEDQFRKYPQFASEQTLWGSSIELSVLFVFWMSKQKGSPITQAPRSALRLLPSITRRLDESLSDTTDNGRIPRAVLGRHLKWLWYFGQEWLTANMPILFPDDNDSLRLAAWVSHLMNESGPVEPLMPQLAKSYFEEIERLGTEEAEDDKEMRRNRLGEYLVILFISDVVPPSMMNLFWKRASVRTRQRAMGFLGRELQLPPDKLPGKYRTKAISYWEVRLVAAIAADDPDNYRAEVGAIGQWFIHDAVNIEPAWLLEQLLRMLKAGFAPNNAFELVKWLGQHSLSLADKTTEVLSELLTNPHVSRSTFMTHQTSIRSILKNGLQSGDVATVQRARDAISVFATKGEPGYLDLVRPGVTSEIDPAVPEGGGLSGRP